MRILLIVIATVIFMGSFAFAKMPPILEQRYAHDKELLEKMRKQWENRHAARAAAKKAKEEAKVKAKKRKKSGNHPNPKHPSNRRKK